MALVVRPWGHRGELIATALTSRSERLRQLREVFLFAPGGETGRPYAVEAVREHRGRVVFKFEGVDTIEQAEALRGAERAAELAVRMLPTPYPSWEGDWDGMVVLRRPSSSTLAVVSACAWASEMLFLVSTIVDPSRHLSVVVLRPKGVLHEERGIAQHLVQTNM
ncbi:MAG: hypothetical protein K6U02_07970, partial [Firmicutes bacterium]|nr:hypothetical protein [Bacillota bacterium]